MKTLVACGLFVLLANAALAQEPPYQPVIGQQGKDVVWVPTPLPLVEKMLDMARLTPQDYVIDLGSGDGRNVIAAAKRGARGLGVEFNEKMVELSRRNAAIEGVADRITFVHGDMYEADISQASVLPLFLLPHNLRKLMPKFLNLRSGARIVTNGFPIDGWEAEETGHSEGDCGNWCTAFLYVVPAKVAGSWLLRDATLRLEQRFTLLSGTLSTDGGSTPIANGRLRGDQISFRVGELQYAGRVNGNAMSGEMRGSDAGLWTAKRARP